MESQASRYKPEYLQAFGLLEVEWNRLEGGLFHLFGQVCGSDFWRAHAIFFSLQNHRARRELVEAAAVEAIDTQDVRDELARLMRRMRNASAKRNEIVHTIWEWNGDAWGLLPLGNKLGTGDILGELRRRTETIRALRRDLERFRNKLPPGPSP